MQARANLDQLYSRLSELGKAHPAQRPRILDVANHAGGFFSTLVSGAGAATDAVHNAVDSALHVSTSAAKTVAKTVGSWASGAIQSVSHALSNLF
jgi:hypothetical protein